MFPKFTPKSPDPFMQSGMDAADAKFGHLNAVVDYINADQGVVSDGVTIIGTGTEEDPLIAIGGEGGAGVKTAIAFSTDHLSSTGNEYVIGNVVWYNGNIYRCIANNDSLLPTSTEYWSNLGAGFQAIESPVDWNSTSGNNQILNKPTNFGSPSLQDVTDTGNTTTNDISFGVGAKILMSNGAKIQEGTTDAILGGNGGIALRCSIDYELKWEAGRLFVMHQDGFIIREVRYTGITTPTEFDDVTIGFVENSRWVLDNGDTYVCSDPTEDAADWQFIFNNQLSITDVDGSAGIIAEASRAIKVQGPSGTFQGLKYRHDYSAEYVPLSLIARQDAPKLFALAGKPSNTSTIPSNYGDIYVDTLSEQGYYAKNITSVDDWVKLNDYLGSYYNPTQFIPVLAQPIFFEKFFFTKIGKIINAKGIVTIEFGGIYGYQSNFKFTIPYTGAANIYELFGSITGYGLVTINHKIIHTRLSGDLTINLDESVDLTIEVDNSMDGSCSFVLDFTYEVL